MGYRIGKTFGFAAAHRLAGLPLGHKCARLHGHNYTVEVILTAEYLAGPGFVTDFGDLDPLQRYLTDTFDHRDLNTVLDVEPTSEALAHHLADWLVAHLDPAIPARLAAVRVSETPSTWAEYRVEDGHPGDSR